MATAVGTVAITVVANTAASDIEITAIDAAGSIIYGNTFANPVWAMETLTLLREACPDHTIRFGN